MKMIDVLKEETQCFCGRFQSHTFTVPQKHHFTISSILHISMDTFTTWKCQMFFQCLVIYLIEQTGN